MGTLAAPILIASTLAAGAMTAVGQVQAANTQAGQAKYYAAVARNNKIAAQYAADQALEEGRIEALNQRIRTNALKGRQRAALAANGVDVGFGSAVDIVSNTAQIGETDALTIQANAQRQAMSFMNQSENFGSEAKLYDASAKTAKAGLPFEVAGTALSTAGTVAGQWYNLPKAPTPKTTTKYYGRSRKGMY